MALISIKGHQREGAGKGSARALRREGFVPAVLYGQKQPAFGWALEEKDALRLLNTFGAYSRLMELVIDGKKNQALLRDIQCHPVTDRPIHLDFLRIDETSSVRVMVPIHLINQEQCSALKRGGILNIVRPQLEVRCAPSAIPDRLSFDIAKADFGVSIRISQVLNLPAGVEILAQGHDHNLVVATITGSGIASLEDEDGRPDKEAPAAGA